MTNASKWVYQNFTFNENSVNNYNSIYYYDTFNYNSLYARQQLASRLTKIKKPEPGVDCIF